MDPATAKTEWPVTPIPQPVKNLLNRWYALTDDKFDDAAMKMSKEIFTLDGTWVHPKGTFVGEAEISRSRTRAWDGIASRRHEVLKVYTCNIAADDLLMTGNLIIELGGGRSLEQGFCGRAVIDQPNSNSPKFKFFQGWMDTGALRQAKETLEATL